MERNWTPGPNDRLRLTKLGREVIKSMGITQFLEQACREGKITHEERNIARLADPNEPADVDCVFRVLLKLGLIENLGE